MPGKQITHMKTEVMLKRGRAYLKWTGGSNEGTAVLDVVQCGGFDSCGLHQ